MSGEGDRRLVQKDPPHSDEWRRTCGVHARSRSRTSKKKNSSVEIEHGFGGCPRSEAESEGFDLGKFSRELYDTMHAEAQAGWRDRLIGGSGLK